ncbi:MAG: hypothetical protein Q7J46_14215 [Pseudomonas sp.]|nr:hypothetical protein [Pseudomonas sp.]
MLRDVADEEILAVGWPWHGRAVTIAVSGVGSTVIEMPDSTVVAVDIFRHADNTHLFDMGLPDIPEPAVEAAGGAWWGRAILRSFGMSEGRVQCYWGSGSGLDWGERPAYQALPGVPLWWPGEDGPRMLFIDLSVSSTAFIAQWQLGDTGFTSSRSFTAAGLGQAGGQPACAARSSDPSSQAWLEIPKGGTGDMRWTLLSFTGSRVLYGLTLTAGPGSTGLPHPTGTDPGGFGSASPSGYHGLIEIELNESVLDPEADHSTAITLRVIENRSVALGNPGSDAADSSSAETGSRNYRAEQTQQSGLLTAWYGTDGTIRSARYNRHQLSTLVSTLSETVKTWRLYRTTTMELTYGGSTVDARTLSESLDITASYELNDAGLYESRHLTVQRKITETGEEDDIVSYDGPSYGVTYNPDPLPVYMPGAHMVMGVVAYIVNLNVFGNVLDEQDVRLLWFVPHSNNCASICRSREPYEYPDGGNLSYIDASAGPAIGPNGPVAGGMSRTIPRPRTTPGPYWRSFFAAAGIRWLMGTANPVTGQVARSDDFYITNLYGISWV